MVARGNVLIAESDKELRLSLYRQLLSRNVVADTAVDGREALQQLASHSYDVMLVDLALRSPGADSVFDRIAAIPAGVRPMVLAVASDHDARELDSDLIQIVIRKPLDPVALAEIVESCLKAVGEPTDRPVTRLPKWEAPLE